MNQKNILLLIVDCLRADRFLKMAQDEKIIGGLMQSGCYCTQAMTTVTTTTPSVASMLTGLYPFEHGVLSLSGYKLTENCITLPQCLKDNGYNTAAFITGPLLNESGLDRGFCRYVYREESDYFSGRVRGDIVKQIKALRRPWFVVLHLWEMHERFHAEKSLVRRGLNKVTSKFGRPLYEIGPDPDDEKFTRRYDETLKKAVSAIRYIVDNLDLDLLIILGDHGERLTEPLHPDDLQRCRMVPRHGFHVYDYLLHIPLLFAGNDIPSGVINTQVSTVDIFPTVLDYLSLPQAEGLTGQSLWPLMNKQERDNQDRVIFCSASGIIFKNQSDWIEGIRTPEYKYICRPYSENKEESLYNLKSRSGESENVLRTTDSTTVNELRRKLSNIKMRRSSAETQMMDAEEDTSVMTKLKELGYI
ncbi:MAG: sulfatase-like hydrolase/transferase [Thermodesulfobacteriota bacterium]